MGKTLFSALGALVVVSSACADVSTDTGEATDEASAEELVATAESELLIDASLLRKPYPTVVVFPNFRSVSCPLFNVDASTWSALPSSDLPGDPADDGGYFPAAGAISGGYAGNFVTAGALRTAATCSGSAYCTSSASWVVWSGEVPAGDCRRVPVQMRLEGRLRVLNDELHVELGKNHFDTVIELRFSSAHDVLVRVGKTGAWTYAGTVPSTDNYYFSFTGTYSPSAHTFSLATGLGSAVTLSGVNLDSELGAPLTGSLYMVETSSASSYVDIVRFQTTAAGFVLP